jgi:predicted N-acetyltransferase YhbS
MNTVKTASNNTVALPLAVARFVIRAERGSDVAAREALLDTCFGDDRLARTCQRIRDGRLPAEGLAFVAVVRGKVVGTVRLWHVSAGGRAALVLGPLAVDPSCQKFGLGAALMRHAIDAARTLGHGAIILLGDAPYYARFGFQASKAAELHLPGAFERERLLGLELSDGALDGAWGMIVPTGKPAVTARGLRTGRRRRLVTKAA